MTLTATDAIALLQADLALEQREKGDRLNLLHFNGYIK